MVVIPDLDEDGEPQQPFQQDQEESVSPLDVNVAPGVFSVVLLL